MTPKEIVDELDTYIIGQQAAKKAVACAVRNRWRRMQLDEAMSKEIIPKNILMIGPTGVGKTEIARRLAALSDSPFIKVEATKFTEVGYVGRDVESIIRDLVDVAIKLIREQEIERVQSRAEESAIEQVLQAIIKTYERDKEEISDRSSDSGVANRSVGNSDDEKRGRKGRPELSEPKQMVEAMGEYSKDLKALRKRLLAGELDDLQVAVETAYSRIGVEIMGPPGLEETVSQLQNMIQHAYNNRRRKHKMKVKEALKQIKEEESEKLINEEEIQETAVKRVEQNGIVFIDEIDKLIDHTERGMSRLSPRGGVERDLLPLVEGCSVFTKYGIVRTDHILFIAAGSFHGAKPSDLIPELQGRFPIRVELDALTKEDFIRILREPSFSLTKQYVELMKTEGLSLIFQKDGIERIADYACQINQITENIGARRLYTVMEYLLETLSFEAPDRSGQRVRISAKYVNDQLTDLLENQDLSRYIL